MSLDSMSPERIGDTGVLRWPGTWRVYVATRSEEIRADAERALTMRDEAGQLVSVGEGIGTHLARAESYARGRHGLRRWLTGHAIEGAWSNVNSATVMLYGVLPTAELCGRVAEVVAIGRAYLPSDDPRLVQLQARLAAGDLGEDDRPLMQSVLRAAYTAQALETGRVRSFRNLLLGGIVMLSLIVLGVVLVGAIWPNSVPMCGNQSVVPAQGLLPAQICPTGGLRPGHGDVPLVALVGILGAALSAATSLSTRSELSTRYSLAVVQNLLKAPAGVATAVLGLLILNSGFVPGFSGLSSQPAILVWAMAFGYGQQIVTRFVDQRADTLLSAASPLTPSGRGTRAA
ncbi:hypothetical protein [Streptosporangium carneum]|uniref:Uncharacterized protein n=1 Tax=Streptosporangium carneum TaxID=47481 RepID=A0A9W6HX41_9ACTN|nr:hypothetical protein [Streptosporangium carneum]GLK07623.1 hypothetical protein GCM10017600_10280 [Streptosporangium carneum]